MDRLTVRLVSSEDTFLFKLIAGRDDDIENMKDLCASPWAHENRTNVVRKGHDGGHVASTTQRNPMLPVELSGVFFERAAKR